MLIRSEDTVMTSVPDWEFLTEDELLFFGFILRKFPRLPQLPDRSLLIALLFALLTHPAAQSPPHLHLHLHSL